MSVAVAITVTIPNMTAAQVVATGTDVALTIGPEVTRLLLAEIADKKLVNLGAVSVAATVT